MASRDDETAFDAFVRSRSPMLLRTAHLLTGDRVAAERALTVALRQTWQDWRSLGRDRSWSSGDQQPEQQQDPAAPAAFDEWAGKRPDGRPHDPAEDWSYHGSDQRADERPDEDEPDEDAGPASGPGDGPRAEDGSPSQDGLAARAEVMALRHLVHVTSRMAPAGASAGGRLPEGLGSSDPTRVAARGALRRELAALPPGLRAVVVLRHAEGLPVERVAAVLGEDVARVEEADDTALELLARDDALSPYLVGPVR